MKHCFFAILCVLCVASCSSRSANQPQPSGTTAPSAGATAYPKLHIQSRGNSAQPVRIIAQNGNRKVYELIARSSDSTMQSAANSQGVFRQTHVTFYGPDGSTLSGAAPIATVDTAAETITLGNGVHAKSSDGITLDCDQLEYDRKSGQLIGTGNVRVVNPSGEALSGGSFRSDLRLSHVHVE